VPLLGHGRCRDRSLSIQAGPGLAPTAVCSGVEAELADLTHSLMTLSLVDSKPNARKT
jgi:hypothetical protein